MPKTFYITSIKSEQFSKRYTAYSKGNKKKNFKKEVNSSLGEKFCGVVTSLLADPLWSRSCSLMFTLNFYVHNGLLIKITVLSDLS